MKMIAVAVSLFLTVPAPAANPDAASRFDESVKSVPTAYRVFMSGKDAERIVQIKTGGCRTTIKTSGGITDTINWSRKDAEPEGGVFAQHVGTRNAAGTLASFTAHIPGDSAESQAMGTRYKAQFAAIYANAAALWKSCSGS